MAESTTYQASNYYSYLFGANGNTEEKPVSDETPPSTVVQDEAIGKPWTHRFTIYCANPSKDFVDGLKKNECVVAVYEKAKETSTASSDKEEAPSNEN